MESSSYFRKDQNTFFSKLNKSGLQDLLTELNGFYIDYLPMIGLNLNEHFGLEIEYEGAPRRLVDYYVSEIMRDYRREIDWESIDEATILRGGEVTSRILGDEKESWLELKQICQFLKDNKADNLTPNAAGHIHFWAAILGNDYNNWRRFTKMYAYFENILYRFGAGDKINLRECVMRMSPPIADLLVSKMWRFQYARSVADFQENFPMHTKYLGVNLKHVNFDDLLSSPGNTIEFRFFNASLEETIWQNNVRTMGHFLDTCTKKIDEDYLDFKLREMEYAMYSDSFSERLKNYREVCLDQALLFGDMVFDNNYDKACFLKQYIKGFQTTNESNLVLARRFIK